MMHFRDRASSSLPAVFIFRYSLSILRELRTRDDARKNARSMLGSASLNNEDFDKGGSLTQR